MRKIALVKQLEAPTLEIKGRILLPQAYKGKHKLPKEIGPNSYFILLSQLVHIFNLSIGVDAPSTPSVVGWRVETKEKQVLISRDTHTVPSTVSIPGNNLILKT